MKKKSGKALAGALSVMLAAGLLTVPTVPASATAETPEVPALVAQLPETSDLITEESIPATDPMKGIYAPITGYFQREVAVGETTRTVNFYVPADAKMGTYGIMLNVPSGMDAEDFLTESGWIALADQEKFALVILENVSDGDYVAAAYKEMTSNAVVRLNTSTYYMVGYGEEGRHLEEFAMSTPLMFGAAAFINASDITAETAAAIGAKNADAKTAVLNSEVPTPVWIMEDEGKEAPENALNYWKTANYCGEEGSESPLGGTAYTQEEGTEFTAGEKISQVIYQNETVDMTSPELTAKIYKEFLKKYLSYGSVATGWLTGERADYEKLGVETIEFTQTYNDTQMLREYMLYIPESVKDEAPGTVPVLLSAPGAGSSDAFMFDTSMWWKEAEEEGFILAVVSAVPGAAGKTIGSIGWDTTTTKDLEYITEVVTDITEDVPLVDTDRIYFNGQSQGCVFACHVGSCLSDTFAAVATTSCARYYPEITTQKLIPYYTTFGEFDNFKNWGAEDWDLSKEGAVRSQMKYWMDINGTAPIDEPSNEWTEGRFTTTEWNDDNGVSLVAMTKTLGRGHCTIAEETDLMWDYVENFSNEYAADGSLSKRYYSESAFEEDDAVVIYEEAGTQIPVIGVEDIPATDPMKGIYAPITGYFQREIAVGESTDTVKIYIPEDAKMGTYGIMINVPEGMNTEDFLAESGWTALADEEKIVLVVLEDAENPDYVAAVYKEITSNTLMRLNTATYYMVGYGEGGRVMEEFAMSTPLMFGAAAFINAGDITAEAAAAIGAKNTDAKTAVLNSEVPTPVWIMEDEGKDAPENALNYWKTANYCGEEGSESPLGGTAYTQEEGTEFTAGEKISQVIYQNETVDVTSPELTAKIYKEFLKKYLSYGSVATGWLTGERADYEKLGVETIEYIQNFDDTQYLREYMLYVPESVKNQPEGTVPVLISAPGAGSSDAFMFDTSMWWQKAEEEGFILAVVSAVPGAAGKTIGSIGWDTAGHKDLQYVCEVLVDVFNKCPQSDRNRVYFNGQSQGCVFACHVGSCLSDHFAAVAATSCARYYPEISSQKTIPYYTTFGEFDNFKNWGAEDWDLSKEGAVRDQMNYWLAINGAATDIEEPSTEYTEGRFTTMFWNNGWEVPVVGMTKTMGRGHCTIVEETDLMWDYLEQFRNEYDEEGSLIRRYYSPSAFEKNDTVKFLDIAPDIEKLPQTITLEEVSYLKKVGDKSFNLNAKFEGPGKVTYKSSNPNVATISKTGKVTIKNSGKTYLTITMHSTEDYQITRAKVVLRVAPAKAVIKKVSSPAPKTIKLQLVKDPKSTGYEVEVCPYKTFRSKVTSVTVRGKKNLTLSLKKYPSGSKMYVRVRAYRQLGKNKLYGEYSKIAKVTVK